jgi:hypothetical protein
MLGDDHRDSSFVDLSASSRRGSQRHLRDATSPWRSPIGPPPWHHPRRPGVDRFGGL